MEATGIYITRFEHNGKWVDVVFLQDEYEVWITEKNCGVSELLFGIPYKQKNGDVTFDDLMAMVEATMDDEV